MEKLKTIQQVIRLAGLSREEFQELVGWLISEGKLDIFDCFADSHITHCFTRMNQLCDGIERLIANLPEGEILIDVERLDAAGDVPSGGEALSNGIEPEQGGAAPSAFAGAEQEGDELPEPVETEPGLTAPPEPAGTETCAGRRKPRLGKTGEHKAPRFSKNGKPLGRPPKSHKEPDGKEAGRGWQEMIVDLDKLLTLYPERRPQPVGRNELSSFFIREEDIPELKKLRMGLPYKHKIVYECSGRYVISDFVLRELHPVCVCLMYQQRIRGYCGFGVAIDDDHSNVPIADAAAYAQTLPEIDGEKWQIINSMQNAQVRGVTSSLNMLFRKLGGEAFIGLHAAVSMDGTLPQNGGKIRYVVNLK